MHKRCVGVVIHASRYLRGLQQVNQRAANAQTAERNAPDNAAGTGAAANASAAALPTGPSGVAAEARAAGAQAVAGLDGVAAGAAQAQATAQPAGTSDQAPATAAAAAPSAQAAAGSEREAPAPPQVAAAAGPSQAPPAAGRSEAEKDTDDANKTLCPICQEAIGTQCTILPCGHQVGVVLLCAFISETLVQITRNAKICQMEAALTLFSLNHLC